MRLIKSVLVATLAVQVALSPLAFSLKSNHAFAGETDATETAKSIVANSESQGWTYLTKEKKPMKALDLVVELAKTVQGDSMEFYALSSNIAELNTKIGVKFIVSKPSEKEFSYKMLVMDKDFKNTLTGRKITIKSGATKEANALKFQRSMKSMEAELIGRKGELTQNSFMKSLFNTILPSAVAYESTLAKNLMTVAGGAATLGTICLLFSITTVNSANKGRTAIAIAPFVVAVVAYVAAGIVEDSFVKDKQKK